MLLCVSLCMTCWSSKEFNIVAEHAFGAQNFFPPRQGSPLSNQSPASRSCSFLSHCAVSPSTVPCLYLYACVHRSDKDKRAAEKRARDAAKKRAYRARLTDAEAKVIRDREAAARRQQRAAQSPAQVAEARAAHAAVEARRRAAQSPAQAAEAKAENAAVQARQHAAQSPAQAAEAKSSQRREHVSGASTRPRRVCAGHAS